MIYYKLHDMWVNIIPDDALVTLVTRASSAMILTQLAHYILVPSHMGLIAHFYQIPSASVMAIPYLDCPSWSPFVLPPENPQIVAFQRYNFTLTNWLTATIPP